VIEELKKSGVLSCEVTCPRRTVQRVKQRAQLCGVNREFAAFGIGPIGSAQPSQEQ
jgi:hypothetical protein